VSLAATAQEAIHKKEEKAGFKLQCPKGKTSSSSPPSHQTQYIHTHTSHYGAGPSEIRARGQLLPPPPDFGQYRIKINIFKPKFCHV
jgi:hypothetical protein